MSDFVKYPHLERFGNLEVQDIEIGEAHVFPKLDGSNGSLWLDPHTQMVQAGSRNRILSLDKDNAGFYNAMMGPEGSRYRDFLLRFPHLRLYGEWLVPHSLRGYREDAWRKFYIFDVYDDRMGQFLPYDAYHGMVKASGLEFIPCYSVMRNGDAAQFHEEAKKIRFLLADDCPFGEGIVIKNYKWVNRHGRVTWAKMVLNEFKEKNIAEFGPGMIGTISNEETVVSKLLTGHVIDKVYDKLCLEEGGWSSKKIPALLEMVYYDFVREEMYDAAKLIKFGTINFKALRGFTNQAVKAHKKELFS